MSDAFNTPAPFGRNNDISAISQVLASGKGWMKLVGIVSIIQGALMCVTIIYAIIGWLPIWIGVLLLQASSAIERAEASGDEFALRESLAKLKTYFVIQGVLFLVGVALFVLAFLIFGATILATLRNGGFHH